MMADASGSGGIAVVGAEPRRLFEEAVESPASNSSTTPQTDNREPEQEEVPEAALPESTQQPVLETIAQPVRPVVDPRQLRSPGSKSERRRRRKKAVSDLGPMVSAEEPAMRDASPTSVDLKARSSYGRSRRSHRRTYSEEELMVRSEQEAYYAQMRGGGGFAAPHPQMLPAARQQEIMMQQQGMRQVVSPPANVRQSRRRQGHHRVRSLPVGPDPIWDGQSPPHGLSAAGNPLIPILNQDGVPVDAFSPDGRRKRRQQYSGNRGRASSASGAVQTMYGSFQDQAYTVGDYGGAPLQPPQLTPEKVSPRSQQQQGFSPRGEFMQLANAFSPQKSSRGLAPTGSPYEAPLGRRTPPLSPAQTGYSRGSPRGMPGMSPRLSPQMSSTPPSALRRGASASEESRAVSFSPAAHRQYYSENGAGFGEDFIQVTKKGGKHRRTAHSLRKMNMRQQSAQIFMETAKGTVQPKACRDVLFAVLFVLHLAGMVYLGANYGKDTFATKDMPDDDDSLEVTVAYKNVIYVASLCGAFAIAVSALVLWFMSIFARRVVQVALILTIGLSFAWGTIGIGLSPKNIVPITGIIALALSVGYTFVVWDRIPFASANLLTALSAIRENVGTVLISFCFQGLALGWSIYYTYVVLGVYDALQTGDIVLGQRSAIFLYTMLGVSYYWTFHVLLNIVQVAVAGTIGCWWFKEHSHFCDGTFARNVLHALTFSFGSICFGSLLVGPVRLIRQLSVFFRPSQDEESVLMCIHECLSCIQNCIASFTDTLASYFNPWAFTYVGLYGYGLLDAGHNATTLFEKRGWTKIVADDLIPNILLMISLVIGGVTGCFGFLIEDIEGLNFMNGDKDADEGAASKAFAIGLAVGLVLTSVLFGIISSSVNAVLVCFAGSPVEFEKYHPYLSQEMRSAWREVWPGCMSVVDIKVAIAQESGEVDETTPLV